MEGVLELSRDQIVGGPKAPAPASRRLRFEDRAALRARLLRRAAAAGALALVAAGAMATAFSTGTGGGQGGAAAGHAGAVQVLGSPAVASLSPDALSSDGGHVARSLPTTLYGRRAAEPAEPARAATPEPGPLLAPRLDGDGAEAAATSGAPGQTPAALVVAQSNLVWSRLFTEQGLSYRSIRHAPLAAWSEGQCASRGQPDASTYCPHDRTLYLDRATVGSALETLALTHEIGHHVQAMLGVTIRPLAGVERELQADCFAGLWARHEPEAAGALAPGALGLEMAGGDGLGAWERDRIAAFARGYAARTPRDCDTSVAGAGDRPEG